MLSYRHAFHAGNHGDVLKHAVLVLVAQYMLSKTKPFVYVDTHAGAGIYDLQSEWAQKNREFETGIQLLWQRDDLPDSLQAYVSVIQTMNPNGQLRYYPGSPGLLRHFLRKQDKARLFELHNQEIKVLQAEFATTRNVKVEHGDGLQALNAILPPPERRALILLDPSYEIKADFKGVISALQQAYRRFPSGVYMLWYPIINRSYVNRLEQDLRTSGMRDVLLIELSIQPDAKPGMTGSGIILINPPWTLADQLHDLLPYLTRHLASAVDNAVGGNYRIESLVPE